VILLAATAYLYLTGALLMRVLLAEALHGTPYENGWRAWAIVAVWPVMTPIGALIAWIWEDPGGLRELSNSKGLHWKPGRNGV
jgi:hypothetical protein